MIDRRRKYNFEYDKFNNIDSPEKAYWLGFLGGDGSINKYSLRLEISNKDYNHLIKFKDFMKYNGPIKNSLKNCCIISLNGKCFVSSLYKHNLYENKTTTYDIPNTIPDIFLSDYLRGLLESDGWITKHIRKNNRCSYEFGFSSYSPIILNKISKYLNNNCGCTTGYILQRNRNNQQVSQLIFGGNVNFKKIANFLYNKPIIYLDRKYQILQDFLNDLNNRVNMTGKWTRNKNIIN